VQGVPEQFIDERDSARFRHLAQLPGLELYHAHISATPLSLTPMKPSASARLKPVPNAFAIAAASISRRRNPSSP
jgi:hypothetical protein